jgi:FKBP-type peptidyl-prolyl cis-trans isomerase
VGTVYRDAGTGEYVTQEYALANPSTTVSETQPDGTIEDGPTTTGGVLNEEGIMANEKMKEDPRAEQAQEQQARREAEAAERQAQKDARKAQREEFEQAHPDQTLPEDLQ